MQSSKSDDTPHGREPARALPAIPPTDSAFPTLSLLHRADVSIQQFIVEGMNTKDADVAPRLVTPTADTRAEGMSQLLKVAFETNPLSGFCDQSVNLEANPLQIAYHAVSHIEEFAALSWSLKQEGRMM